MVSKEIARGEIQSSFISRMFKEISSAGGVGRKYQECSKSKRIRCWHCWSRCWCPLLSLCHRRKLRKGGGYRKPATLPNKDRARIWSVQGSFFRRGRRKKVLGRFQRQAHTAPCGVIKEMRIDDKIRSSEVSSGKFLPPGA